MLQVYHRAYTLTETAWSRKHTQPWHEKLDADSSTAEVWIFFFSNFPYFVLNHPYSIRKRKKIVIAVVGLILHGNIFLVLMVLFLASFFFFCNIDELLWLNTSWVNARGCYTFAQIQCDAPNMRHAREQMLSLEMFFHQYDHFCWTFAYIMLSLCPINDHHRHFGRINDLHPRDPTTYTMYTLVVKDVWG